ncbi:hypothetical protein N7G274_003345 [Stereocaulon virgatum]|uniref:Uncharacterized protein n=1 Tax=Stereocaulon virgatum TaxID=373712 RepID=A0ABR4AEE3_9LECA
MNTLCSLLIILAAVTSHSLADVQFTFPTAGAREVGNTAVYIAWKESGKGPAISSFDKYNLSLCAGGNSPGSYAEIMLVTEGGYFAAGNNAADTVPAEIGESIQYAYFYSMNSSSPGGIVVNFSDRFSLSGMTGSFPPNVRQGAQGLTGTNGPGTQNNIAGFSSPAAPASTLQSSTQPILQSTAQPIIQSTAQSTSQSTAQSIIRVTTQSANTSPTATNAPAQSSSGLSSSSKLGLGLGVPLGIMTIAFAAILGYIYGKGGRAKAMAPTMGAHSPDTSRQMNAPIRQRQGWRGLWTSQKLSEMEGSQRYREELPCSAPYVQDLQGSALARQKLHIPPYSQELEGSLRKKTG